MEPDERDHLEAIAQHIAKRARRRMYLSIMLAAFVFSVLQTAFILGAARLTSRSAQALADRVDRNVAFTACVLRITHPAQGDIARCLHRANLSSGVSRKEGP